MFLGTVRSLFRLSSIPISRSLLQLSSAATAIMSKPSVVFVLGPPGAGKGTQCENIVKEYGYTHLSAGDLLRAERNSGSDTAELINNYIKEGAIVPVAITVGLIKKAMKDSGNDKFLIDGFPRNKDNFDGWREVMGDAVKEQFVLFLECDEECSTSRCLSRSQSMDSGRVDDNLSTLKKRHQTYETSTKGVIEVFASKDMVRQVDATMPIEDVWAKIQEIFESHKF
eukprot:m.77348 g.77348  ORF g.77348 m.77348 type:complete len:226 (-) comp11914_c0_seq1:172-849(-)